MYTNNLVLIGNLVDSPEVQVTNAGTARTRFRIASTERRRDAATNTWLDGESVFVQVTCWRRLAENVAISLDKGDRVIVCGRLRQWVAEKDGVRRTVHEIEAETVGPDLQRGMVAIARTRRTSPSSAVDVGPDEAMTTDPLAEGTADEDLDSHGSHAFGEQLPGAVPLVAEPADVPAGESSGEWSSSEFAEAAAG